MYWRMVCHEVVVSWSVMIPTWLGSVPKRFVCECRKAWLTNYCPWEKCFLTFLWLTESQDFWAFLQEAEGWRSSDNRLWSFTARRVSNWNARAWVQKGRTDSMRNRNHCGTKKSEKARTYWMAWSWRCSDACWLSNWGVESNKVFTRCLSWPSWRHILAES